MYKVANGTGTTQIWDLKGNDTYNIKKGYEGKTVLLKNSSLAEDKDTFVFDKSYKLTNASNVTTDDTIITSASSVTFCPYFTKSISNFSDGGFHFLFDVADDLKDGKVADENSISAAYHSIKKVVIGGKNYSINNLDILKQDLTAWFKEHDYADTSAVFSSRNQNDINSLMAVYTEDTASCFTRI